MGQAACGCDGTSDGQAGIGDERPVGRTGTSGGTRGRATGRGNEWLAGHSDGHAYDGYSYASPNKGVSMWHYNVGYGGYDGFCLKVRDCEYRSKHQPCCGADGTSSGTHRHKQDCQGLMGCNVLNVWMRKYDFFE
jgi:hypothetical protein